jgi:hypothetical protein
VKEYEWKPVSQCGSCLGSINDFEVSQNMNSKTKNFQHQLTLVQKNKIKKLEGKEKEAMLNEVVEKFSFSKSNNPHRAKKRMIQKMLKK